jgi:hypothetical protein
VEVDLLKHEEVGVKSSNNRRPQSITVTAPMTTQSLVETMREEIRLENEKMRDATKSLMEGDDLDGGSRNGNRKEEEEEEEETSPPHVKIPTVNNVKIIPRFGGGGGGGDRKFSAPEIGLSQPQQVLGGSGSGGGSPFTTHRTRSLSLRQASVDSIGDSSDLGSPDGGPILQRAMSCDSVCSDTSVVLGDLDTPHVTGHLCVGLEYDR